MGTRLRVGVVGGGISGLSAALRLARLGHEPAIFQREREVGGLIGTFDLAGTRIEHFYHFLCGGDHGYFELAKELGLGDRLRFAKPLTGFHHEGRTYPFTTARDLLAFDAIPFSQRLKFGVFALESGLRRGWTALDREAAKPWLIRRLGQRAYDVIWEPLLTLKFGDDAGRVSAAWVSHRIHRVARSHGRLGYLEGGTALLLDTLTDALARAGVAVHRGTAVERVLAEDGRVTGLRLADGTEREFDRVVSTVPLAVLANLLPPGWDEYAAKLREIRYIGVACASFKLRRAVTPYFWLNVNDARIPFNGIIEYTNLNPMSGKHVAYVPYYVPTDSPTYSMATDALLAQTWSGMKRIAPDLTDDDLVASHVARAPFAQAICPTNFLSVLPAQRSPLAGLHLLDSVFLYPEDRTQSGNILKANACAAEIDRGD
jgi:protoporphyrinogen oxidase